MRYRVIQLTGNGLRIVCNVPEADRAMRICDAYEQSYVIDSNNQLIYSNVTTEYIYGRNRT